MVTSKGFTKKKKFLHTCKVCRKEFYGADCKGSYCTECKLPKPCSCGCGIKVIRPNCFYASGHNPNSNTKDTKELASLEFRLLFKDRNGLYRIFGLYNGLSAGNVSYNTGSGKGDLNGIKIDFTGQEESSAYFIENPADAGFIDLGTDEPFYFLYQNEDRFLLQDSNFLLN